MIPLTLLLTGRGMISVNKKNRGLSIRDLHIVNRILVIHTTYNIANFKDLFLSALL